MTYEEFLRDMIVACQRMAAEHADRARGFLFSGRNRAFSLREQWHAAFWAAEARRHLDALAIDPEN